MGQVVGPGNALTSEQTKNHEHRLTRLTRNEKEVDEEWLFNRKIHFNTIIIITRDYYYRSLNSPNRNVITHRRNTNCQEENYYLHGTKLVKHSRQNKWPFHFQDHNKPINES